MVPHIGSKPQNMFFKTLGLRLWGKVISMITVLKFLLWRYLELGILGHLCVKTQNADFEINKKAKYK